MLKKFVSKFSIKTYIVTKSQNKGCRRGEGVEGREKNNTNAVYNKR